ncbi:MAG: peroxidase [Alphaproteobacteria bacterium]|nr:MAG: peroxidase [Alphaproteobacteria bacterium]
MPRFPFLSDDANMVDVFERQRARMVPLGRATEAVMHGPSALDVQARELIAAFVSGLNGCRYCHESHRAFAEAHGVPAGLLKALLDDLDHAPVEDDLRALLAFCRKLTETPSRMVDADYEAMRDAGWSDEAIEDAIFVTALFNLYNRLMDGYGMQPRSPDANRRRAELIREYGYDFTRWPAEILRPDSKSERQA